MTRLQIELELEFLLKVAEKLLQVERKMKVFSADVDDDQAEEAIYKVFPKGVERKKLLAILKKYS